MTGQSRTHVTLKGSPAIRRAIHGFILGAIHWLLVLFLGHPLHAATLMVQVTEIKEPRGQLIVLVCDNENCHKNIRTIEAYQQWHRVTQYEFRPLHNTENQNFAFENLPPGSYTVFILHDLNSDQKPQFEGELPLEPFGMSGLDHVAPKPEFENAAIHLTDEGADATSNIPILTIDNPLLRGALKHIHLHAD